ncbi:MAG: LON peptidase substrate-binding domain-containing protein, partial [Desulfovibrionaceae bacterium]|nr:LON peptidase substrate-binding domain-containing protein [Desulfovibrionaceae bacterium]
MEFSNEVKHLVLLPLMPLREVVVFPKTITPLYVGRESSIKAIDLASGEYGKKIFLITQKYPHVDSISQSELYSIGTIANILQMLKMPDGTIKVLFEGLHRAELTSLIEHSSGTFQAHIQVIEEPVVEDKEQIATIHLVREALEEYGKQIKKLAQDPQ